jgi:hypothetical protein
MAAQAAIWECLATMTPLRALTGILLCSLVLIVPASRAQDCGTNAWTKPGSGYWEEAFWSCERLPGLDQWLIAFTNSGSKTLAIGENTTANFSNSLAINDLMVDAPDGSVNELLLNRAGTNTPLSMHDLKLGPNGSLVSYNSALTGYTLYLNSRAHHPVLTSAENFSSTAGRSTPRKCFSSTEASGRPAERTLPVS